MAVLFVLALLLIFWQAWRTEPLPAAGYSSVTDPGGQVLPVAVPSWRALPQIPLGREERRSHLEGHAIGSATSQDPRLCRLFLRISTDHWLARSVSAQRWRELTPGQPGRPGPGGPPIWSFGPDGLLDDDDRDGDFLDPGELTSEGLGAEVELFCPAPTGTRVDS